VTNLRERFDTAYTPRAVAFADAVGETDVRGIPEPHLPHWGKLYESSPLRVGIIGRDTMYWGELADFIETVRRNPAEAIHLGEANFDSLEFTKWTNNFGRTFWDTAMRILAGIHGVADWKRLKGREEEAVLRSFFWANTNAVELFESTPKGNGVLWENWRTVKDASEKYFDSFRNVLDILRPHVVILMNWDPGDNFLDFEIRWDEYANHQAHAFDKVSGAHILATAHPNWLNRNGIYDEAVGGIIERCKSLDL